MINAKRPSELTDIEKYFGGLAYLFILGAEVYGLDYFEYVPKISQVHALSTLGKIGFRDLFDKDENYAWYPPLVENFQESWMSRHPGWGTNILDPEQSVQAQTIAEYVEVLVQDEVKRQVYERELLQSMESQVAQLRENISRR